MEAGRRVTARLERIETLQEGEAPTGALLAELRGLLEDGEAWLAAGEEATGCSAAGGALGRREDRAKEVTPERHSRTLI
jgi:hypothetical protein